jgi:hypothetical protein
MKEKHQIHDLETVNFDTKYVVVINHVSADAPTTGEYAQGLEHVTYWINFKIYICLDANTTMMIHIQYWSIDGNYRMCFMLLRNGETDELLIKT